MNHGSDDKIRLLLVGGVAAMLLLFVSFLISFIFSQRKKLQYQQSLHQLQEEKQRQLAEATVQSEESERIRIAEQLHDEVGALLSACKLYLRSFEALNPEEENQQLYSKGLGLLDVAIIKIRGIAQSLHSQILKEFGLNAAINHFSNQLAHDGIITMNVNLDDSYVTKMAQKDISVYRVFQELINNIIKHAKANKIDIKTVFINGSLTLTISHNGEGIRQEEFEYLRFQQGGIGLKNIQNRINFLKGNIKFDDNSINYTINITIPSINEYS